MAVIDVEPFVTIVKENDLLYNKNRTDYKDHEKKMGCGNNIGQMYGVPVSVVLAKWKSLREKYIKERKQVRMHRPSAVMWEHHHLFKFLDPYILPRNRSRRYRALGIRVMPSSIPEDAWVQGIKPEEKEHDACGEVFENSSTVEDHSHHCPTSIHPAPASSPLPTAAWTTSATRETTWPPPSEN